MNLEERLIAWLELNQRPCEERDLLNDAYERLEQLASANRALSRANTHVTARLAAAEALDRDYQEVRDRLDAANARLAAAERERDEYKRLYDLRGKALLHPCLQCGYQPKVVRLAEAKGGWDE